MSIPALTNPFFACCSDLEKGCTPQEVKEDDAQHLPIVWAMSNILLVEIGSLPHPMEEEHYIKWVCLKSQKGMEMKKLNPGDKPQARFYLDDDKPLSIYVYCSVHGLLFKEFKGT